MLMITRLAIDDRWVIWRVRCHYSDFALSTLSLPNLSRGPKLHPLHVPTTWAMMRDRNLHLTIKLKLLCDYSVIPAALFTG